MAGNLQSRKQELVRNAIYDAAIELFAARGFDQTTVEEVALAAGVSRRTFFRYFESKDHLLAQSVVSYGKALVAGVAACTLSLSPLEMVRETVAAGARYAASQPHTRQTIGIAVKSASARQAHQSRLIEVEDSLARAFTARVKNTSKDDIGPRLLASLTLLIMNRAIMSWYRHEHEDLSVACRQVFAHLTRIFSDTTHASVVSGGRTPANPAKRTASRGK
jgi:AcrR family transcriptional regulator